MKTAPRHHRSLDQQYDIHGRLAEPDRYRQLDALVGAAGTIIPYGSGLSYTAAAYGGNALSVSLRHFNRILGFDEARGIIHVEGGIPLSKLYDFLAPRGYEVPVQPGHPQLTIGGIIAANAHGKNQFKEGVFANILEEFTLLHPRQGRVSVSRHNENKALFDLTAGGYGLTGLIVDAKFKVQKFPGAAIRMENRKVADLHQTIDNLNEYRDRYDFLQSWHDLSFPGASGKGFITCGAYVRDGGDAPAAVNSSYQTLRPQKNAHAARVFYPFTVPFINAAYYANEVHRKPSRTKDIFSYLFPVANKSFYFKWYGGNGLIEHQVLIPHQHAHDYVDALLSLQKRHGLCIPRLSMKLFSGTRRYLHYNGAGISLSMDLFGNAKTAAFLADVDALDIQSGAYANLIKDSRLSRAVFEKTYPEHDEFRSALRAFDPDRCMKSALSERLGL